MLPAIRNFVTCGLWRRQIERFGLSMCSVRRAGGLFRDGSRATHRLPVRIYRDVDSAGEVIGSPDRGQQGWTEDEHGNRVTEPVPSTVLVTPEQLRKPSELADCSVGWLVRRAVRFWLESADAKSLKGPDKDRR